MSGEREGGEERFQSLLGGFVRDLITTHAEKIRYLFVGVMNTVIGFGLFAVLLWLLGPLLARLAGSPLQLIDLIGRYYYLIISWIGWILAVPISTLNMKYLAFRSPGHPFRQVLRAYFVYLPAQGIGSALLWLTVDLLGMPPLMGQFITIFITTIFSYLGHKYFTFGTPASVTDIPATEQMSKGEG